MVDCVLANIRYNDENICILLLSLKSHKSTRYNRKSIFGFFHYHPVFPRVLDHACYLVNILAELRDDIHAYDHTPSFIFEKLLGVSSVLLQTAKVSPQMDGERLCTPCIVPA
jgi:hypothetical protein